MVKKKEKSTRIQYTDFTGEKLWIDSETQVCLDYFIRSFRNKHFPWN